VGTTGDYNVFIGDSNVANKTAGVFTVTDTICPATWWKC